ncbi:MAG: hypothetical protein ACI9TF_000311 [Paracrocinitomix sp.]|jgi:hypothetical protein
MQNDLALLTNGPLVSTDELRRELGWELKPEGLCREDVCVLVPDRTSLEADGKIDAVAVAALLDRPALVDEVTGVVAIGAQRSARQRAIDDLQAPNFVLPDLDGTPHALSDHRSKKRLLVAFSSW